MKKVKILCMIVVFLIIQSIFPYSAYSIDNDTSKIDAVLVLDVSGSMTDSDPRGISFEAANMFIDMCSVQGDRVGIIAYSDKIVQNVPLKEINSIDDKKYLKDIVSALPKVSSTDIGLGIKTAVEMLDMNHDPNRKPLIILLSDGKAELGSTRTKEQSDADKKEAINIASYKGYGIYTIGLNADGSVDQNELNEISSSTKAKTFITDTPDNLPQILSEIFADHLKLKIVSPGYINGTGDFQDVKITIPDSNVIEANISLLSQNPVEVKLVNNKGQEQPIPSSSVLYSLSNSYSMLKILNPEKGDWILKVKGISGDKIKVNLIFNYDLKLTMELSKKDKIYKGETISVNTYLISNGQKLQDKDSYKDMKASIIIKDLDTQAEKKIDLTNIDDGGFKGDFKLEDNHRYEIKTAVDAKSFSRESESAAVTVENRPCTVVENIKDMQISDGGSKTIDLSKVFIDGDGDALKYEISSDPSGIAAFSLDGSILKIDAKQQGSTAATVKADDGKGGTVSITFNVKVVSMLIYFIIGALVIVLLVLLFVLLPYIKKKNRPLIGQVAIESRDLNTNKLTPPQYKRLNTYRGKVSLYELLQLLPEYKEGEKIILTRGKNDTLILKNMTFSTIERTGRIVDASKGCELKFGDRVVINLSTTPKSISMEYFN